MNMQHEAPAYLSNHKKIVVLGEAGSGKTELSMNLAVQIHQCTTEPVRFLDMDETKTLYRARDAAESLLANGVTFTMRQQISEAPVVPYGVIESLKDPAIWTILDVGGGHAGALCMGQFSDALRDINALAYYTINSYRAFSDSVERIQETMNAVLSRCHLRDIQIVSNPYLGESTTAKQFLEGQAMLRRLLEPLHMKIDLTAIPHWLWKQVRSQIDGPAVAIKPYLKRVITISPLEINH